MASSTRTRPTGRPAGRGIPRPTGLTKPRSTGPTRPRPTGLSRSRPTGRYARTGGNRGQGLRRRAPEPSGLKKLLGRIPTGAAKKAAPSSNKGRAGGLALFAAAAGMAFKNRDKLGQMRQKAPGGSSGNQDITTHDGSADNTTVPPTTPSV